MEHDKEVRPARSSPFIYTFVRMHHLVGKRDELVEGGYDTFGLRGIVLDHLNGAKEERVASVDS